MLRPAHEHLQLPLGETRILRAVEHVGGLSIVCPRGNLVLIASGHIEIDSRDVALDLIRRFEHLTRITFCLATPQLAVAVGRLIGDAFRIHFCEGIVAATVVHIAIGWHHMMAVALHGRLLREPALRYGMLAIVALSLSVVRVVLSRPADDIVSGI